MKRSLMRPVLLLVLLAAAQGPAAQTTSKMDLKAEFLWLCDDSGGACILRVRRDRCPIPAKSVGEKLGHT